MVRRASTLAALTASLALVLWLSACGGDDETTGPTASTSTSPAAVAEFPPSLSAPEVLESGGRYETTIFKPQVTITLPEGDWETAGAETSDSFAIRHYLSPNRDAILAIVRISKVFDPQRGGSSAADGIPAPADFVGFLTTHPNLSSTEPQPAQALGLSGESVDVEVTGTPAQTPTAECPDKPCLPLYLDGPNPVVFGPGDRIRYYVLDGPDGQLVAELYVSPGSHFEEDVVALDEALDGYEISG